MANTGIRQLTTVVGGYAKRIWYSLNGTTPTAELMSIDDAGVFRVGGINKLTAENGSTSVPHATPTTIFTGLDEDAKYDVFVYMPGYQISQCYISATMITSSTGAGSCFIQNETSPSTISLSASGLNLQVIQGTGSPQPVYWKVKKMY